MGSPVQATMADIASWLEAEVITGADRLDRLVSVVHSGDLMSDVLAFSRRDAVLLTGLSNEQVVRTAEVAGMLGVVFVRGKLPHPKVVEMAAEFNLPLMLTGLSLFDAGGRLYSRGLRGHARGRSDESP